MADPKDICECGDYRSQHEPDGGPCRLNALGHGMPGYRCEEFRFDEVGTAWDRFKESTQTSPNPNPGSEEL